MFPLYFHYEDVSRQDPLLKPNRANVMEVPGSCKIRLVPKAPPSIKNGKLAMEIPRGHKLIQTQRASTGKPFRSNPFLGSNKDQKGYVSDLARQSTLRGRLLSYGESRRRPDLVGLSITKLQYRNQLQTSKWDQGSQMDGTQGMERGALFRLFCVSIES